MNRLYIDWLPDITSWMLWCSAAAFAVTATVYVVRFCFAITIGLIETEDDNDQD